MQFLKPIPVDIRAKTQPFVVVACLIVKDNKFLLVQEGTGSEKGMWNHPAGWLDIGEDIIVGAKREAEEETGLKIQITEFLGVYNLLKGKIHSPQHGVKFLFVAQALTNHLKVNEGEILDAKWFNLEEIENLKTQHLLRDFDIINQIKDYQEKKFYSLEVIKKLYNQIKEL